jgi:eukaryotic-like serine/threonine-protein kinase
LADAAVPDLAAQLYAGPAGSVIWRRDGVQLGEVGVRTDPLGRVYPRFSAAAGTLLALPQANAQELLFAHERPLLAGQIVIFGMHKDPDAANLAAAIASLYVPALAHTPGWGIALEKILVLLICAYLLLVVPHLRTGMALLLSVLVGVLIAAAQLGVYLVHAYWLTLAVPLTFLLLGQILVTFTARGRANWNALIEQSDKTALTLARRQLEQGELEGALESISGCAGSEQLRELLYEIGIGYERKRHYEKAANVFGSLVRGKRDFRDAAERLAVLVQLRPAPSWQPGRSLSGGTLVMPQGNLARPVLGRYEIERELGRGAVGVVYLGKDPKIGRQVAIKTVDLTQFEEDPQEFKLRFFREAEAAGRLSHPNIVTIYDVGEEKDLAFIAMDYMPGRALSAHTRPENLLAPALVLQLLAQVADALDYAHRQGVIHRDIKPDNLIYDEQDGRVKVADFGIARLADTTRTRTGAVLGSPSYMSPEQITGQNVDGRSDIFSLGVTVFQLITGQLPFQGETVAALAYQISQQKHKDLRSLRPELSPAIGRLLNKALQKQPERRYASAAEFAAALRKSAPATTTSTAS